MFVLNIVYLLFNSLEITEGIISHLLYQATVFDITVGSFLTMPESVVQAEGLNATFFCSHQTASATGWRLNGTSVNMRHPQNVIVGTTGGGSLHYLTILATADYNGTTVQCFTFVMKDGSLVVENATTVLLVVQGMFNNAQLY